MDRIHELTPTILLALVLGGVVFIYVRLISNRYRDRMKSLEYAKTNKLKMALLIGFPTLLLYAPLTEEIIFRAPLILLFSHISDSAWLGISVSALLFGSAHWSGQKFDLTDIPESRANGEAITDDLKTELELVEKSRPRMVLAKKILHVIITTLLGLVFGYYGIKHQSLWLCIALHAGWNLIGHPIVIILYGVLAMPGMAIYVIGALAADKILMKLRERKKTRSRKNRYVR